MKNRSGAATLVAVILVSVVALFIGISASERGREATRETTYNTERDKAFSVAEGGIDVTVDCIKSELAPAGGGNPTGCPAGGGGALGTGEYDVTVTELTDTIQFLELQKDHPEVFNIEGQDYGGLEIEWSGSGSAMEVNVYTPAGGGGGYDLQQTVFTCNTVSGIEGSPTSASYVSGTNKCKVTISDPGNVKFIQFTPRVDNASNIEAHVTDPGFSTIQGYEIASSGIVGTVQRNVVVEYLLPHVGRVFNSSFYAESVDN